MKITSSIYVGSSWCLGWHGSVIDDWWQDWL